MGSVGKNPHRPEGKKGPAEDSRRMSNRLESQRHIRGAPDPQKQTVNPDKFNRPGGLLPDEYPAEEMDQPMGGSRPGVPSRVKEAIEERRDREADESD